MAPYTCAGADFAALRPRWNALLARSHANSVFLTVEWLEAWWRHLRAAGDTLQVLAVHDPSGTLVGIAPFCRGRVRIGGVPLRCLRFVGDGSEDSDYLDCIVAAGHEEGVLGALLGHLLVSDRGWEILLLRGMRAESPTAAALPALARAAGLAVRREPIPCAAVPLPADWEGYLRGLQPRFRTKLRAALRFVDAAGDAGVERCEDAERLDEYLEQLFALHQQRWTSVDQPGSFAMAGRRAFYRDFAAAFRERGWLGLCRLRLHGRIVAVQIGFEYERRFFQLQEGFDPGCGALSVGIALRGWIIRELIARGVTAYDFLGGYNEYKARWGARLEESVGLLLARPGLRARVGLTVPPVIAGLKTAARRVVPEAVLALRERWRSKRGDKQRATSNE
jgi:CelD/BcsL family acetyltransferase involved in cellulose biosynthesis